MIFPIFRQCNRLDCPLLVNVNVMKFFFAVIIVESSLVCLLLVYFGRFKIWLPCENTALLGTGQMQEFKSGISKFTSLLISFILFPSSKAMKWTEAHDIFFPSDILQF